MGYESKLVVVRKWEIDASSFGETIAELNLCKMPHSFFPINETFECEVDKPIFLGHEEVSKDCYCETLRYTSVEKLLKILYKCENEEHYRRTEMAINFLKSFTTSDWDNIVVVHYGY